MTTHLTIRNLLILSLIGLVFASTAEVNALSMTPYSLDELWSESHLIVKGEVIKTRAYRSGGRIFTEVTLTSSGTPVKGEVTSPDHRVRFSLPGGQFEGITQHVPGVPTLYVGEMLILFLRCTTPNACAPVGYGQGIWRALKGQWAPLTHGVHWVGGQPSLTSESLERLTTPR